MKRCPQCNKVFEDEKAFCTEDGSQLVGETFSLPSDFAPEDNDEGEQETVMRYKPLDIDISDSNIPEQPTQVQTQTPTAQPQVNQYAPNHGNIPPQIPAKENRGCFKYGMILLIGSIIGGGLVLVGLAIGYVYMNSPTNENANVSNEKTIEDKQTENVNSNSNKSSIIDHSESNQSIDESKLNGRIIKSSANLRSSPSSKGKIIERLPNNDRIEIIRRKSSSSKWYEVKCEHGSKGWIDGYSIEFTS